MNVNLLKLVLKFLPCCVSWSINSCGPLTVIGQFRPRTRQLRTAHPPTLCMCLFLYLIIITYTWPVPVRLCLRRAHQAQELAQPSVKPAFLITITAPTVFSSLACVRACLRAPRSVIHIPPVTFRIANPLRYIDKMRARERSSLRK